MIDETMHYFVVARKRADEGTEYLYFQDVLFRFIQWNALCRAIQFKAFEAAQAAIEEAGQSGAGAVVLEVIARLPRTAQEAPKPKTTRRKK